MSLKIKPETIFHHTSECNFSEIFFVKFGVDKTSKVGKQNIFDINFEKANLKKKINKVIKTRPIKIKKIILRL